jgi:ketosteroid isomerase-like protein
VSGSRTGKASLADFFSMLAQDQEALLFEPRQFVAQGDLVVALGGYRWRVKATGREVASDFAHVFTVRNGRIVRFQEFMDTARFVAAYAGALTTA